MNRQVAAYRRQVIDAHPREFAIHQDVGHSTETALRKPRTYPTIEHVVLDMLMVQSVKTHGVVSLLAEHGLMEDTATAARRLLELSVQATYIGAESEEKERMRRAGSYLAFMWRQLPRHIKLRLPAELRAQWTSVGRSYGRVVRRGAKRWGPNFWTMFTEVSCEDLYLHDYSMLSSIAHGSPESQVFQYSRETVQVHSHEFASVLLLYSSRYHMATTEQWNRLFDLMNPTDVQRLTDLVLEWRPV